MPNIDTSTTAAGLALRAHLKTHEGSPAVHHQRPHCDHDEWCRPPVGRGWLN
jgi:hypothetical protein